MHVDIPINGLCESQFLPVRQAFTNNFTQQGEIGARVCVIKDGQHVVDLWGGFTDESRTTPWQQNTLVNCMSVTKGVVALAAHLLHGGQLGACAAILAVNADQSKASPGSAASMMARDAWWDMAWRTVIAALPAAANSGQYCATG